MLLGDFDDYRSTETAMNIDLYFIILLGATLFIVIVMLNLLIAIISDAFEKVMALEKQAEVFEKLQLIIEVKGKHSKPLDSEKKTQYLFELTKEEKKEGENLEERLRSKIDKIEKSQESHERNLKGLKEIVEGFKHEVLKGSLFTTLEQLKENGVL